MRRSCFLLPSIFSIVVATFLTSCEAHKIDPEQQANITAWSKEIAYIEDSFIGEYNKFYASALTLVEKIKLLTNYHGWPDMATILSSGISTQYIEGEEKGLQKSAFAFVFWSLKYGTDVRDILSKYHTLRVESLILESERIRLISVCDNMPLTISGKIVDMLILTENYPLESRVLWIRFLSSLQEASKQRYSKLKENLTVFRVSTLGLYEMNAH